MIKGRSSPPTKTLDNGAPGGVLLQPEEAVVGAAGVAGTGGGAGCAGVIEGRDVCVWEG
jgi:uncharacterized protein GlcG (DUF336 family)